MSGNRFEPYQMMRIVGEKEFLGVERMTWPVPDYARPVKKILDVMIDTVNSQDMLFTNKVIKEGVLLVQIIYVSCDDFLRYVSFEMPFHVRTDVPGAQPGMYMQNQIVRIEKKVEVVSEGTHEDPMGEDFNLEIGVRVLFRVMENIERKPGHSRRAQGQSFSMPSGRSGAGPRRRNRG